MEVVEESLFKFLPMYEKPLDIKSEQYFVFVVLKKNEEL
jgi:hypothetical protein